MTTGRAPVPGAMRRNLVANFVAQTLGVLLNLACVPIFLHLLGPEQYGLVGFAVSLQAMLAVLDLGLATTANREFSRTGGQGSGVTSGPVMLRTLELVYFGMGTFVALVLVAAAPWIADHWLQVTGTPREVVRDSLMLLGLATGLRWPVGLYSGVLLGLERQVPLNAVVIARSTLRTVGAALALMILGGTVVTYFGCLVVVSVLELTATAWLAWRSQPARRVGEARFDVRVLRSFWEFSGELTLISVFAAVLKQEDKVIIGRFAPWRRWAHYTVASTLSAGLLLFATPVFTAVFPRLTSLMARGEDRDAASVYHRASALVSTLPRRSAAALILFPGLILSTWTRSPSVASEASGALVVLADRRAAQRVDAGALRPDPGLGQDPHLALDERCGRGDPRAAARRARPGIRHRRRRRGVGRVQPRLFHHRAGGAAPVGASGPFRAVALRGHPAVLRVGGHDLRGHGVAPRTARGAVDVLAGAWRGGGGLWPGRGDDLGPGVG